jgi:hypothetical protein
MGVGSEQDKDARVGQRAQRGRGDAVINNDKGAATRMATIFMLLSSSLASKCGKKWSWVLVVMMLGSNGRSK